jgi:Glycosyltransferase like family
VDVFILCATRKSPGDFQSATALGKSLVRIAHDPRMTVRVSTANTRGLPLVYNEMLDQLPDGSTAVFVHDDVWIDDFFMVQRVVEGLEKFDVIGLAGNRRRAPGQPAWAIASMQFDADANRMQHLSGGVAHGPDPGGEVTYFGEVPAACELLDGVFLAAKKKTLIDKNVRFDPLFDFHFYDMDFCRTARQRGLRLGTWPICITHQSEGDYLNPAWRRNYQIYMNKWGD